MNIARVGVDIAKSVFHVHGVDCHDSLQWHFKAGCYGLLPIERQL